MKNTHAIRLWSLISGVSIFIMALAAGIAYGMIFPPSLYREADPMQTLQLIEANSGSFHAMILLFMVILVTDLLVSYGFCVIITPVGKRLAFFLSASVVSSTQVSLQSHYTCCLESKWKDSFVSGPSVYSSLVFTSCL